MVCRLRSDIYANLFISNPPIDVTLRGGLKYVCVQRGILIDILLVALGLLHVGEISRSFLLRTPPLGGNDVQ